jgi:hypothetical protein
MNHPEESFKDLEIRQPENIFKFTLIDEATGHIDQELEFKNSVGLVFEQKANHAYKEFANNGRYAGTYSLPLIGGGDMAIALFSGDYGISADGAYAGVYRWNGFGEATNVTHNFPFYVGQVIDLTHLYVYPNTTGMISGDTISQLVSDASDTTRNIPFCVRTVTDGQHLILMSTVGLQNGDTIQQSTNITTITSVDDGTHITVGSTTGWVASLRTTTISIVTDANNLVVADTTDWITYDGNGNYGSTSVNRRLSGFNYQNAITISGTGGGIYLPNYPDSGYQRNRSIQWVYEWGTTQGNGQIAAVGFFPSGLVPNSNNGNSMMQIAQVPEMRNADHYTYAGFQTVLGRHQLHFVSRIANIDSTTKPNLLAVINHDDFSLVQQKTINSTRNGQGSWSASQKDIIFTPNGASGNEYWIVITYDPNVPRTTFQKVTDVPLAVDVTNANSTFKVISVTDLHHLVVDSTTGMTGGDTIHQIIQGVTYTTTITIVVDATHLIVGTTKGWNSITFGDLANNTTQSIPFFIVEVLNSTQIRVPNTAGMHPGDTIVQGINSKTISSIPDATTLNLNNTTSLTDGRFNISYTKPNNWSQVYPYDWCSDGTNIYGLMYNESSNRAAVLTINPVTSAAVSLVPSPISFGLSIGDSQAWNICPVTGKLMTIYGQSYIMEFPSITTLDQPAMVAAWLNNQYLNTNAWKTFIMHQTVDKIIGAYAVDTGESTYYGSFFEFARGNYFTYATLPVIITKSNTQSLRVQYTLHW